MVVKKGGLLNPTFTPPKKNFHFLLYKFVTLYIAKEAIRPYLIGP